MFGALGEKLQKFFSGKKTLTEDNISDAVKQVHLALLEADVNYTVVTQFVKRVKEKALGGAVVKSVSPSQQFIKIVHEELVALMGQTEVPLDLKGKISVIMLCGLQGSGKTTASAKLARFIAKNEPHKRILLVACDLQRPAAIEQLKTLGAEIAVPVFAVDGAKKPLEVAKLAMKKAESEGFDVVLVDTAGRLHLDEELMGELAEMKQFLSPREVLFVANAATGQDAVRTAAEFDKKVQITGSILTMLDGNARAGCAISIREVTGKPLRFEGMGEKVSGDFRLFNPRSMADRVLDMGDVIHLVNKAKEHFDEKESAALEAKILKASFTYEDYLKQMGMVKKMGSLKSLIKMMPGASALGDLDMSEKEFAKMEAIIFSMTPRERQEKDELCVHRRKRIAGGSGTHVDDVNRLVKGFKRIKQMCKNMPDLNELKKIKNLKGNNLWR
jgi:signal recognition particle subunit SRP54